MNIHAKNNCKNHYDRLSAVCVCAFTGDSNQISNNGGRLYGYSYYVMVQLGNNNKITNTAYQKNNPLNIISQKFKNLLESIIIITVITTENKQQNILRQLHELSFFVFRRY